MMNKYLVVEDYGARMRYLRNALGAPRYDVEIDHIDSVNQLVPARSTVGDYPPEKLAEYEGFFIDFNLQEDRYSTGVRFDLNSVTGNTVPVKVTTGIGVMLYLRQVQDTPEYLRVRQEIRRARPARPLRSPFFSFALLREPSTLFFAPAARSWFGAPHFSMQVSIDILKYQFDHLDSLDEFRLGGKEVFGAVSNFDYFMAAPVYPGEIKWNNHPNGSRVLKDMYDWLQMYLEGYGKKGGVAGFNDALLERHETTGTWKPKDTKRLYAPRVIVMQQEMYDYLSSLKVSPVHGDGAWESSKDDWVIQSPADRKNDLLWEILRDSQNFWTQEDVRIALTEHTARVAACEGR